MTQHVTTHQAEEDSRNEAVQIYVDGRIVPKAEAVVSVFDSGFMLGDGVWEGLRLYNGRWAFIDEHLERLFSAAKAIDLDIGMSDKEIKIALIDTQKANNMVSDAHARVMITRGIKSRPFQHPSLSKSGPTIVMILEHSRPKIPRPVRLATCLILRSLAHDPRSKAQLTFETELHIGLYSGGKSRSGRSADARYPRICEYHKCL